MKPRIFCLIKWKRAQAQVFWLSLYKQIWKNSRFQNNQKTFWIWKLSETRNVNINNRDVRISVDLEVMKHDINFWGKICLLKIFWNFQKYVLSEKYVLKEQKVPSYPVFPIVIVWCSIPCPCIWNSHYDRCSIENNVLF